MKKYIMKWIRVNAGLFVFAAGLYLTIHASIGIAPWDALCMGISGRTGVSYGTIFACINVIILVTDIVMREPIGFGTLFNALFIGSLVDFFYRVMAGTIGGPGTFPVQLLVMLIGMVICSFGLSLYQCSDLGVSPYDAASLILDKKLARIPYFWCRIFTDGVCALICFAAGGIVGVGTLVTAFGFGPFIAAFNRVVSPMIGKAPAEA